MQGNGEAAEEWNRAYEEALGDRRFADKETADAFRERIAYAVRVPVASVIAAQIEGELGRMEAVTLPGSGWKSGIFDKFTS